VKWKTVRVEPACASYEIMFTQIKKISEKVVKKFNNEADGDHRLPTHEQSPWILKSVILI